jgi:hypothetical protein
MYRDIARRPVTCEGREDLTNNGKLTKQSGSGKPLTWHQNRRRNNPVQDVGVRMLDPRSRGIGARSPKLGCARGL